MEAKGVHMHLSTQVNEIVKTDAGISVVLDNGSSLEAGLALYATGRQANTAGLGSGAHQCTVAPQWLNRGG